MVNIVKGNLTNLSNTFLEPVLWFWCPGRTLAFLHFLALKCYQSVGVWQNLSPNLDFAFMVIIFTFQFVLRVINLPKNAKMVNRWCFYPLDRFQVDLRFKNQHCSCVEDMIMMILPFSFTLLHGHSYLKAKIFSSSVILSKPGGNVSYLGTSFCRDRRS